MTGTKKSANFGKKWYSPPLELTICFPLCAEAEETMAAFSNSVPPNDLAGKSLSNCPMRVN